MRGRGSPNFDEKEERSFERATLFTANTPAVTNTVKNEVWQ